MFVFGGPWNRVVWAGQPVPGTKLEDEKWNLRIYTFFESRRFDQWIFSAGPTIGKKAFVITFLLSVLLIYQVYIYMYMWP